MSAAVQAHRPTRHRRIALLVAAALGAILLAVTTSTVVSVARGALVPVFQPGAGDGVLVEPVTIAAQDEPAIARLDPALMEAVRRATDAAAADGIRIEVTSGWRSKKYQEQLLADAIREYGSEAAAREYVASPDTSRHVTGQAVDLGPADAQSWLTQHGATWGLCQIYANERWHFELAIEPGGQCPAPLPNAAG